MDPQIIGQEIKKRYPKYAKKDDADLGQRFLLMYGPDIQGIQQGSFGLSDIEEKKQPAVRFALSLAGFQKKTSEQVGEETKRKGAIEELGGNLSILEKSRKEIKKRGPLLGLIPGFGGATETQVGGFETAKNITAFRMAEVLAGQTGRAISDRDRKVFFDSLPKRTDRDIVAEYKINTTLDLLGNKLVAEGGTLEQAQAVKEKIRKQLGYGRPSISSFFKE